MWTRRCPPISRCLPCPTPCTTSLNRRPNAASKEAIMAVKTQRYYVPAQSPWPIVGALGLFLLAAGAGMWAAGIADVWGPVVFAAGTLVMTLMLFGWFSNVISESHAGLYSEQMDRSFRQGMTWFIFSEVMFFGAFF